MTSVAPAQDKLVWDVTVVLKRSQGSKTIISGLNGLFLIWYDHQAVTKFLGINELWNGSPLLLQMAAAIKVI